MARVSGIKIEKDIKGNPRFAHIDLRKYGKEIEPFLQSVGAIDKDDDIDLSKCLSCDEFRVEMEKRVRNMYDK